MSISPKHTEPEPQEYYFVYVRSGDFGTEEENEERLLTLAHSLQVFLNSFPNPVICRCLSFAF